jgi:hypothetical protein
MARIVAIHSANPALAHQPLIDEFGELLRKVAEAEVRITREVGVDRERLEAVKELIQSWYEKTQPEIPVVEEGKAYFLEVTPREWHRDLDIKAKRKIFALLKVKLGADPLGLFGMTLETVKTQLGTAVLDSLASKDRTGARKLKAVAKSPATATLAA